MLKIRIIPCLDVKDGKIVKGTKFVNLKYAGDPVKQAQIYDKQGADELCFLDITASSDKRNILLNVVKNTAQKCFMPLTVGGGIRSIKDIRKLLLCGADKVSINTAAIRNPNLVKESSNKFGLIFLLAIYCSSRIRLIRYHMFLSMFYFLYLCVFFIVLSASMVGPASLDGPAWLDGLAPLHFRTHSPYP